MTTTPADRGRGRIIGEGVAWTARWTLRLLIIALGLAVLGWLVGQLWEIVFPVVLGLIIATVLEPPVSALRRRRVPGLLATALVLVVAVALLAGIVVALAPTVSSQAPQIVQAAGGGVTAIQQWLAGPPFNLGTSQLGQYVQMASQKLQESAASIAGGVITGISAVASGVVTGVVALVLAFLFVKDGPRFLPWLERRVGSSAGHHFAELGRRAWARLGGFIRSQAIIGFVDAACIGIGLVLFGVPLALPLAVLTFFGAFIPIVGSLVAGALSVLIALVVKGPGIAIGVLVLILFVQQVEGNLLQPLVQGKGLGLHASVVILAVTGGGGMFGVAGAFLAVPVAAVAAEIFRYLDEQVARKAGESPPPDGATSHEQAHRSSGDDGASGSTDATTSTA